MHAHTLGVSRERPDFVRGAERCWIDGDLIRLSSWPIGGIRPNGRRGPVPWLMDLAVLEEAMQEVYGGSFRLGDRAPLLQMAVNALAAGDRRRAAEIANEVSFPPPEYASRLRNAGLRYLNWGPAHRRGNPPIDLNAWLERKAWERKYDSDQSRVPRGHPDSGQWTDDPSAHGYDDDDNLGNEPLSEDAYAKVLEFEEEVRSVLADQSDKDTLRILAAGGRKGPPGKLEQIVALAGPLVEALKQLRAMNRTGEILYVLGLANEGLRELLGYVAPAEEMKDLVAEAEHREFASPRAFKDHYKSRSHPDKDWHHIVEKDADFPAEMKHNTSNMVQIPRAKHWKITQFYSTPNKDFGGLTPREWLRGQPYEVHVEFGRERLREVGALK